MAKKSKKGEQSAAEESNVLPETNAAPLPEPVPPIKVVYCKVCTLPVEYCEFGSSLTRCKEWLKEDRPDLFSKYYSEEALQAKIGTLSLEAQQKLEKDTAKKEVKAEAKAEAAKQKKLASQITIRRVARNKNKFVTAIHGLEAFDIELKKAAKQFASKFATGSSVSKNAAGQDEIVIQGDVAYEVIDMLEDQVGVLKGVPTDNVEVIEDKKKKSG